MHCALKPRLLFTLRYYGSTCYRRHYFCLICFHFICVLLTSNYNCEQTGHCAGVYPSQGEPEYGMGENTILATREALPYVFIALIITVWLASGSPSIPVNVTSHLSRSSPTVLSRCNVIVHGGQETGTVGVRKTSVGGSDSLIRIIPSTIFSYIRAHTHPRIYTLCPNKWTTQLTAITLSIPNRFSIFYH